MIRKLPGIIIVLLFIAGPLYSQPFQKRFQTMASLDDTTGMERLLKEWQASSPKDPELLISRFNYYARKSMRQTIAIEASPKNKESIAVRDTATGKPLGYMNITVHFDPETLQKGFATIDYGISLYPNRLDMRFGKIFMLGQSENYAAYVKAIVAAIEHDNKIRHQWLWKDGKPLENNEQFFLAAMHDYSATIYNTNNDKLLPYMRQISESVLKYYPNNVESLSNIALTFLINGNTDQALPYLLRAEAASPKDMVILNNIAETYYRKKDKTNAMIYYNKMINMGNAKEADHARKKIAELEKM